MSFTPFRTNLGSFFLVGVQKSCALPKATIILTLHKVTGTTASDPKGQRMSALAKTCWPSLAPDMESSIGQGPYGPFHL